MINLRYHLVSITAVFLALGLGVIFGSTVVDRGTVSFLEDRLSEVERDVQSTNQRNAELRDRIEELERRETALGEEGTGRVLSGLLEGVPVTLVRLAGSDDSDADLRATLADSGAIVDAVVTLGDDLALDTDDRRARFVEALGLREGLVEQPDRLRDVAALRLAGALWFPAHPLPAPPEVDRGPLAAADLVALAQAGFLTVDRLAGASPDAPLAAGPEVGMVIVTAGEPEPGPGDLLFGTLRQIESATPDPSTVVVTDGDGSDGPVARLRAEDTVVDGVGTVDHVNSFAGRLALVLALRDGPEAGTLGHYGSGPGAQRLVPASAG